MPLIIVSASVGPVTKVARLTEVSVNIILPIKSAKRLLNKCYLRFRIIAFIRDPFCLKQFSLFVHTKDEPLKAASTTEMSVIQTVPNYESLSVERRRF